MEYIIGSFILLVLLILTGVWFYYRKKRLQKELVKKLAKEETRQKLFDFFKSKIDHINNAEKQFSKHFKLEAGYFSNYQLKVWQTDFASLFAEIKNKHFETILLEKSDVLAIKKFQKYYINSTTLCQNFNKKFLKEELKNYSHFFDDIEGRKLDIQQRTSIIADEDNNLVIPGAGSGKTTTIVGKVNYIIDRYKTNPSEILLISFTNKSATTLAERINIKGVEANTFHKFGINVISEIENIKPSIFDKKQFNRFISNTFKELLENEDYLKKVAYYFTDFLKPIKPQQEFKNQGDYFQYLKDKNFKAYQQEKINGIITYKMAAIPAYKKNMLKLTS